MSEIWMKNKDMVNAEPYFEAITHIRTQDTDRVLQIAKDYIYFKSKRDEYMERRQALINEYAMKDEKGNSKQDDKGNYYIDDDRAAEFTEKHDEMENEECLLEIEKIDYNFIKDAMNLCADDLLKMAVLLEGIEV